MSLRRYPGSVSGSTTTELHEQLQSLADRTVTKRRIAHAVLGVAFGDEPQACVVAAGEAKPGTPMRSDTSFFIASITKRFIAALVLQAEERGELKLDDPMVAHLPVEVTDRLHVLKGADHTSAITVHHLLTHTSGLPDYWEKSRTGPSLFEQLVAGRDLSWDFAEVVRMVREDHRPHFPPQDLSARRQRARYSDAGFQLLIAILEAATGQRFAELLQDRIFDPVGMDHTWLPGRSMPSEETLEPAMIHRGRQPLEVPRLIESSNDLASTAGDLLRFQRALSRGELFEHPATVHRLTERANLLRNMPPNRYGVGTWIFPVNRLIAPGHRPLTLVGHAGVTGTWLYTCPELGVHLAGSVDQAKGARMPFRIMLRMLCAATAARGS
jgi:D-alanyl-D-alanine carboxypeptidase